MIAKCSYCNTVAADDEYGCCPACGGARGEARDVLPESAIRKGNSINKRPSRNADDKYCRRCGKKLVKTLSKARFSTVEEWIWICPDRPRSSFWGLMAMVPHSKINQYGTDTDLMPPY